MHAPAEKTLILIRHAESGWGHAGERDYDRTLTPQGSKDAHTVGRKLADSGFILDHLIASTAVRARITAMLLAPAAGFAAEKIEWRDELYLSSPSTMLNLIRQSSEEIITLALLAHNPGISSLGNHLLKEPIAMLPPCGIIVIKPHIQCWKDIAYGSL